MDRIKSYDLLPMPVGSMARTFISSDDHEPEVYLVSKEEFDEMVNQGGVVTQLLFWREYNKYYATVAGTDDRKTETELILAGPLYIKRSILGFYEIDLHDILEWNKKYGDKALEPNKILEFDQ